MRILLVEDDLDLAITLKEKLEQKGYFVDMTDEGPKGSFMGRTNEYDIAIMDINVPGRNGDEIAADIRKQGKSFPIIALTTKSGVDEKVQHLSSWADDYVTKPFSFDELCARITAQYRRPGKFIATILTCGYISLNCADRTVTKNNIPVTLTKKEFAILELLLRNQGQAVSRAEIMEHAWDNTADPISNTIEAHITHLRKKLRAEGEKDYISCLPGLGYKITALS